MLIDIYFSKNKSKLIPQKLNIFKKCNVQAQLYLN